MRGVTGVVAVVQARMGSTRLPGKVLADVEGRPLLARVVERARRAARLVDVVVATTTHVEDDAVEALCGALGVRCVRGSERDVLDRYRQAARAAGAAQVARITADCPLLDPAVVDRVIATYEAGEYEYVSNVEPPTWPDGLDVEVLSRETLERVWRMATLPSEREHVTLHVRSHRDRFRVANVENDVDLSALRWTVDESTDLAFVRRVYARLGDAPFGTEQVLALE